ncbi:MAG TPA: hypothetical protein VMY38_06890 [Gemmatimonadaceae bacterium]|nr:hypothetical protein [Gemmatimonadaceae bacterium]
MNERFAAVPAYLKANSQLAQVAAVTVVVIAMSAWLWASTRATITKANAETAIAISIRETAERFSEQFVGASSAETEEWSSSMAQVAGFGIPMNSRLSLAGSVSRIAEASGLSRVIVRFVSADSAATAGPRQMGDVVLQPAPFGLSLHGDGSALAAARTVLRLPPAVEVRGLSLAGSSEQAGASFSLVVYLSEGGPSN